WRISVRSRGSGWLLGPPPGCAGRHARRTPQGRGKMTTFKHSPSPWFENSECVNSIDIVSGDKAIAMVITDADEIEETDKANARLIASAPRLLAALKRSAEGWSNAIELGLIPPQHILAASILRDEAHKAVADAEGAQ